MELTTRLIAGSSRRQEVISLTHRGQELQWQPIERTSVEDGVNVFEQINAYWATKPTQWLDQVFEVYLEIHQILQENADVEDLTRRLTPSEARLLDLHDLDDIRYWMDFKSSILIPPGMKETYEESESPRWSRDKTYTVEDYKRLVVLSIAFRPMLPVWGEFIFLTKRESKTTWKEYYAFQAASTAKLMESVAMLRLRSYIQTMLPNDEDLQAAVLKGISTMDFADWITAVTVIRRLAIADIRGLPDKATAISFIFLYLSSRTKPWNNNLMGNVSDKRGDGSYSGDSESRISQLEEYKIKQSNPDGDIVRIEYEFTDPVRIAQQVCPDIDLSLLREAQESVACLADHRIHDPQRTLIQYALSRYIPARAIPLIERGSAMQALAISQALFWHRGFHHLAALVSAGEQRNRMDFHGVVFREPKVPQELQDQLDVLYPYHKRLSQKNRSQKEKNHAIIAIDSLSEQFRAKEWVLTLPESWLPKIKNTIHDRKYIVPIDLKIQLTQFVIKLATRSF